jgi:ribonuclease E
VESLALSVLRIIEEECIKKNTGKVIAYLPVDSATYLLNEKRPTVNDIEKRHNVAVLIIPSKHLETPFYEIQRVRAAESEDEDEKTPSYQIVQPEQLVNDRYNRESSTGQVEPAVKEFMPDQMAPPRRVTGPLTPAPTAKKGGLIKRFLTLLTGSKPEEEPVTTAEVPEKSGGRNRPAGSREKPNQRRTDSDRRGQRRAENRPPRPQPTETGPAIVEVDAAIEDLGTTGGVRDGERQGVREGGRRGNRRRRGRRNEGGAERSSAETTLLAEEAGSTIDEISETDAVGNVDQISTVADTTGGNDVVNREPTARPQNIRASRSPRHRGLRPPGEDRTADFDEPSFTAEPDAPFAAEARPENMPAVAGQADLFLSEEAPEPVMEDGTTPETREEATNGETRRPARRRTRSRRDRRVPIRPAHLPDAGLDVSSDAPVTPSFEPSIAMQPEPADSQLTEVYPAVAAEPDLRETRPDSEE